ncbi:hypothetical protein O4J56_13755 [Nocardiopsis sp. RSe5-2]|uniref:Secreted protein n=1 Tax=Nocardiopsis endophytica TaxID=3018445 RepID=A0ABT4U4S1_9ACTN|nr:hypothetical protein [Nocardiopsis endophytica]MDA2811701.1 hypothetical protein [Nocardiopsis endophytica]
MTESSIAIIVAVLGIAGTLGSAVFTQLLASRARQAEIDREERARAAEHARVQADEALATRRACYIAFNAAARRFHAQVRHCTHALRGQERPDDPWAALDETRTAFANDYAELQLTAPDRVLTAAHGVNSRLNWLYGMVRRLNDGRGHEEESVDRAQRELEALWGDLDVLRSLMRLDLGVAADPSAEAPLELPRRRASVTASTRSPDGELPTGP